MSRFLKAQGMNKPKYESKWILEAAAQFPELSHVSVPPVILPLSQRKLPSDPHQDPGSFTLANLAAPGPRVSWDQPSVLTWRGRGQLLQDLKLEQHRKQGSTKPALKVNFPN